MLLQLLFLTLAVVQQPMAAAQQPSRTEIKILYNKGGGCNEVGNITLCGNGTSWNSTMERCSVDAADAALNAALNAADAASVAAALFNAFAAANAPLYPRFVMDAAYVLNAESIYNVLNAHNANAAYYTVPNNWASRGMDAVVALNTFAAPNALNALNAASVASLAFNAFNVANTAAVSTTARISAANAFSAALFNAISNNADAYASYNIASELFDIAFNALNAASAAFDADAYFSLNTADAYAYTSALAHASALFDADAYASVDAAAAFNDAMNTAEGDLYLFDAAAAFNDAASALFDAAA